MSQEDDKPRWSFTWLLRIQRTGRPRPELETPRDAPWYGHWVLWLLCAIVAAEFIVLVLLDVLPIGR